jgi:prepilin-type N-terminal cleavage/methylation domain-containing protein
MRYQQGFQLLELLTVLAVLGLATALSLPQIVSAVAGQRLRSAASELVGTLRLARSEAIARSANVAVRFDPRPDGNATFTLFRDGDDDGVLNADIASGVDLPVGPPRRLSALGQGARFGFPRGTPPTDPGNPRRPLERLDDPIRFNNSNLASFDPLGGSTPGSLYLTDGVDRLVAVRVVGRTGRVRVLTWRPANRTWH